MKEKLEKALAALYNLMPTNQHDDCKRSEAYAAIESAIADLDGPTIDAWVGRDEGGQHQLLHGTPEYIEYDTNITSYNHSGYWLGHNGQCDLPDVGLPLMLPGEKRKCKLIVVVEGESR